MFNADGTKFGSDFLITTTIGYEFAPTLTTLVDGRIVACWFDYSQTGGDIDLYAVRAQLLNPDGTKFGSEFLVNTSTAGEQYDPAITALADGRFVVCWIDGSQSVGDFAGYAIRAQVFNADGSTFGSEFLVNTTTDFDQGDPAITALTNGRYCDQL